MMRIKTNWLSFPKVTTKNDYSFFYKNLQENIAKRVAAYKAN